MRTQEHGTGRPAGRAAYRSGAGPAPGALEALARLTGSWTRRLSGHHPRVLLADGQDARCIEAAAWLTTHTPLRVVLVADPRTLRRTVERIGVDLPAAVQVLDPGSVEDGSAYQLVVGEAFAKRGLPVEEGRARAGDPVWLSAAALALGEADAVVAGASRPTAEVIRAGLRLVGLAPGVRSVTSCFLMLLADGTELAFGDCAVIPDPSAEQLADIAAATARTFALLAQQDPVVALLSFSTMGSARHASADKVRRATGLARALVPAIPVDGELQFDAAYLAEVGRAKAPGSAVPGRANVFVFPNLDAGNIAYKITERLAGAIALGPILQGLGSTINDLSRGCTSMDVARVALISAVQSVLGAASSRPAIPLA